MRLLILRIAMIVMYIFSLGSNSMAQSTDAIYLILKSNPSGTLLVGVGTQGIAQILDLMTGQMVADISLLSASPIWTVEWRADSERLALASLEGNIYIYCTDESSSPECTFGELISSWSNQTSDVLDLDWSPNGSRIATASQDTSKSIIIWDVNSQQLVGYTTGLGPVDIDWSNDGQWIAFANVDTGIGYIDVNTFQSNGALASITSIGDIRDATAVAWNNESTRLAIAQGSVAYPEEIPISITIWNISQSNSVLLSDGHTRTIEDLQWSDDDRYLASVGFDTQIIIWDTTNGEITNRFQSPEAGFITLFGITWLNNSYDIAYGGLPNVPPTIVENVNQSCDNTLVDSSQLTTCINTGNNAD